MQTARPMEADEPPSPSRGRKPTVRGGFRADGHQCARRRSMRLTIDSK